MIMITQIRVETHIHRQMPAEEQYKSDSDCENDYGMSFSSKVSGDDEHSMRLKREKRQHLRIRPLQRKLQIKKIQERIWKEI